MSQELGVLISFDLHLIPQATSRKRRAKRQDYKFMVLSGLQKEVVSLYRRFLRIAAEKDAPRGASLSHLLRQADTSTLFVRQEFRRQVQSVKRSNFKAIEYMIRKGEKQLKVLHMPGAGVVHGASRGSGNASENTYSSSDFKR